MARTLACDAIADRNGPYQTREPKSKINIK